jgi:hypothetical protein
LLFEARRPVRINDAEGRFEIGIAQDQVDEA